MPKARSPIPRISALPKPHRNNRSQFQNCAWGGEINDVNDIPSSKILIEMLIWSLAAIREGDVNT